MRAKNFIWIVVFLILLNVVSAIDSNSDSDNWKMFGRNLDNNQYFSGMARILFVGQQSGGSNQLLKINASNISITIQSNNFGTGFNPAYQTVWNNYTYFGGRQINVSNISQIIYTNGNLGESAIAGELIYSNGYVLNASNISQQIASTSFNFGTPSIYNGFIYGGGYQLNLSNVSQQIANSTCNSRMVIWGDFIYCTNLTNLLQLNSSNISIVINQFNLTTLPAIKDSFAYVVFTGVLYKLNASNISQVVSFYNASPVDSITPTISDKFVYVFGSVASKTVIYQLNLSNVSQQITNYTAGSLWSIYDSLVVSKDYVYASIGSLYQFDANNVSKFIASNSGCCWGELSIIGDPLIYPNVTLISPINNTELNNTGQVILNFTVSSGNLIQILNTTNQSQAQSFNVDDAYVDESNATINYGTATNLRIGNTASDEKISYIAFNLSNFSLINVNSVILNLSGLSTSTAGKPVDFWFCNDSNLFNETVITWNNKDTQVNNCSSTRFYNATYPDADANYSINLTSEFFKYNVSVFVIKMNTSDAGAGNFRFASKEHGTVEIRPALYITTSISSINCSLFVNNVLNQTNSSVLNNTLTNFNLNVSLGNYNWSVNCSDAVADAVSETRYFSVWNLSISGVSIQPNATYAGNNVTINATVTGNVSSVWALIWHGITNVATVVLNFVSGNLWSGTVTTNDTYVGINNVTIYANDSLNRNRSVDVVNGLNVSSNDAPVVTLVLPGSSAQVGDVDNVTLNFTATDDHLTSFKCDLYINSILNKTNASTQNNTLTNMIINVSLGTYTWQVKCNDTYKEGASSTRTFYVNDTTAPSLAVQSPTAINYTVTTIGLNYTVSDRHLDKCWYVNVTGQIVQLPSCVNTTFTALQGNNNITVYANDTSNNVNSTQVFFFVDSIAPVISNVATVNGTTSIQVIWDTDENANGTVYWGNTTALLNTTQDLDPSEMNHYVVLTPLTSSTLYYFNLTSCDPYGNCAIAGIYNATTITGNLPPVITILYPLNNTRVNIKNYNLTLSYNVFDDNDNLSNCSLIIDDIMNQTNTTITVGGTYSFNVIMSGGRHSLKVNCTDSLGLEGDPPVNITVPYEKTKQVLILVSGYNYSNWTSTLVGDLYNSTYPANISVDWGADLVQEWNYTGTLSGSTSASVPSATITTWKINNCSTEFCYVDILFKSDTQGLLNITNINLSYQRNESNYPGGITIDNLTGWYNDSWLNSSMITAILNVTPINNWLSSGNCTAANGNLSTDVSSFLSGILYLDNLQFTYGSNITPIVITNATVNPPAVFPNQNFTINATINISGAIYQVEIIQSTLYDGGFGNVNNNVSENFTATRNSAIGRIDVYNVGSTAGNLTLSMYNFPSWTLLGSKTISNYSSGWIMFDFTQQSRIRLANGSSYVFEITSDAGNWNNLGYSNNDTYPPGTMFIDRNPEIGQDMMFRVLMYDYDVGSVWAVIWSGVTTWWTGFLSWVTGDLWSVVVTANQSWGNFVNITVYANTTTGQNASPWQTNLTIYNVTLPIISANITPDSPQNYSPTRVYEIRINCYSPYNITNVTVIHDFAGANVTYAAGYDAGNASWTYSYQRINVGNYTWHATCTDQNGLYNSTPDLAYEIDTAYPALYVSVLPSAVSSYLSTMNISCISDNDETLLYLKIDGNSASDPTLAVFPIGTYFLECNQTGNGNWFAAYANASMTIIDVAPSVNLTAPADAYVFPATTTQVSLEFNVSDIDDTNLGVRIYVNGTAVGNFTTNNTQNSWLYNVTSNSSYTWWVVVNDLHSYIMSENRTFSIAAQSYNQLPTVNLIYPANNSDLANTFIFINFTWQINDTDSANVDYDLYVDGISRCTNSVTPNDIFYCLVGPFMANSTHYWNVSVFDNPNTVWSFTNVFTINATCTPNWVPNYTNCLPTNLNVKSYYDSNYCGNFTTMPVDNGTSTTCDYCTPLFNCSSYHACTTVGRQDCAVVTDRFACFAQTGLPSDAYTGDMSEFNRGCTYQSVLVVIPQEAGAALAVFMYWITTPIGILLLWLVLLAIILTIGLLIAAFIRNRAGGG